MVRIKPFMRRQAPTTIQTFVDHFSLGLVSAFDHTKNKLYYEPRVERQQSITPPSTLSLSLGLPSPEDAWRPRHHHHRSITLSIHTKRDPITPDMAKKKHKQIPFTRPVLSYHSYLIPYSPAEV